MSDGANVQAPTIVGGATTSIQDAWARLGLNAGAPSDLTASATGVLVINLAQIADNWRALAELVKPSVCAAVVKADAYGLGAQRVIPALYGAGCRVFFVATLDEAIEARTLTGEKATIFMLDGVMPGAAKDVAAVNVWPVLSTLSEVHDWGHQAGDRKTPLPCALHVDTGLTRLGLTSLDVREIAANSHLLDRLDVRLIMSHLACADDPHHFKNEQQREVFEDLRPLLPTKALSLAASDGLMLGRQFHYAMVRPGYALYGGQAFQGGLAPVATAVSAYARVLQVREAGPPHTVGYSATYAVPEKTKIATIAAGYADGVIRSASSTMREDGGRAVINGEAVPFAGRVSMDLVTLDVGMLETPPVRGDLVELIGPNLSLEAVGAAAGTIGYEILTSLGRRFHRVYVDTDNGVAG
ncbi:MAG: alanine racemase [Pseudomonadota bacterium]